ncbi:hypothetical protein GCM10017562_75270 [Streptomyces roseofulvus]
MPCCSVTGSVNIQLTPWIGLQPPNRGTRTDVLTRGRARRASLLQDAGSPHKDARSPRRLPGRWRHTPVAPAVARATEADLHESSPGDRFPALTESRACGLSEPVP